jgi:hypothetical protein
MNRIVDAKIVSSAEPNDQRNATQSETYNQKQNKCMVWKRPADEHILECPGMTEVK